MNKSPKTANEQLTRAIHSLHGLSCGDAFGERFFLHPEVALSLIAQRAVPSPPWRFTDDTAMAIAITEILEEFKEIHPERLAESFGRAFLADPHRGYGPAMHSLLPELAGHPTRWKDLSQQLFKGTGSFGNGAAMRITPVGAYFADDLEAVVKQTHLSAQITHSHPEGAAGAIAVAVAAALACRHKTAPLAPGDFLQQVCDRTPKSEVQRRIALAINLTENATVNSAVAALGNGAQVSAQDTVPFSLWAAARHLDSYEDALWTTVSGLGDRDTTCAIVGGIIVMSSGIESIPPSWIEAREPLPAWFLYSDAESL